MDLFCLVSTVQAASGVMVWRIFSLHTLGSLVPIENCLNVTACLSIVADRPCPSSSDGYFQQDNMPCHKVQIISNWSLEHDD